ncbi:D-alanyl-D-alanine carboxypeptidase/D-alanyl-D-alanine-endopeptidase [Candidatus Solirubrobacter pratensis]|uniref:D-alanyl-D-alanine carboxypeptidase/D-alanyl-D-alanine-endopeptidase n=1 Tax=Candidatus Solirubrobacter pratensis TaxID=1298857 RepID=UPI00040CA52F|nr:D-alanyl-D-alanine carboxypeptidase [Candidatus Solirubrobacter pratensis]
MQGRTNRQRAVVRAACATAAALALSAPIASAQQPGGETQLRSTLAAQMAQGPAAAGAYVVDLTDGHVVFDDRSGDKRLSASVTKLYTTSTALMELGPRARLATRVLGAGRRAGTTWVGDLYLRGGGDFTFGTAAFARKAYGSSASVERLATALRRSGLRRIHGSVFGDTSLFRDNGGTPFGLVLCSDPLFGRRCPYGPAGKLERPMPNGPRTPIGFDRGLRNATGAEPQRRPARFAARGLVRALREARITVDGRAGAARTPASARTLAATRSPTVARLVQLINRPSDNYAADTMLRVLGARVARDGSRAGGARVVSRTIARRFGLAPEIRTGSGETILDRTSPRELVQLLIRMRARPEGRAFARSLSLAGESGTLLRLHGTVADGRCQLKDGTRVDPDQPNTTLNITGYCHSLGGRTFAFAVMMNGMPLEFVPPDRIVSPAYALQDAIVEALAGYPG